MAGDRDDGGAALVRDGGDVERASTIVPEWLVMARTSFGPRTLARVRALCGSSAIELLMSFDPSWGAQDFSSETQGTGADKLHGVTHHGPYDGQEGNDDGKYSYFDNGTTAQYNSAKAAMGLGDTIPEGGSPFDRMRQQTKHNWFMYE